MCKLNLFIIYYYISNIISPLIYFEVFLHKETYKIECITLTPYTSNVGQLSLVSIAHKVF